MPLNFNGCWMHVANFSLRLECKLGCVSNPDMVYRMETQALVSQMKEFWHLQWQNHLLRSNALGVRITFREVGPPSWLQSLCCLGSLRWGRRMMKWIILPKTEAWDAMDTCTKSVHFFSTFPVSWLPQIRIYLFGMCVIINKMLHWKWNMLKPHIVLLCTA